MEAGEADEEFDSRDTAIYLIQVQGDKKSPCQWWITVLHPQTRIGHVQKETMASSTTRHNWKQLL